MRRARRRVARGAHVDARVRGRAGSRAGRSAGVVRSSTTSQSGSSRSACSTPRATSALVRAQLDDDRLPLRRPARSSVGVDAGREQAVVAREALLGRVAHRLVERDQRVEPPEQLLALRARGRIAEPVRRDERRDRERVACRGARGRRATAARARSRARRRTRPARARARGSPGRRPARRAASGARSGSPGRPRSRRRRSPRSSARRPASRSAARVDGASTVTSCPSATQRAGDARDVLVDVVRLRPRERRHEADAHRSKGYSGPGVCSRPAPSGWCYFVKNSVIGCTCTVSEAFPIVGRFQFHSSVESSE